MHTEPLEARQLLAFDFGDAPDKSSKTGVGDYQTLLSNGGPSHRIDESIGSLFIGTLVDGEPGQFQSAEAGLDDQSSPKESLGKNRGDEDGIHNPLDLEATVGDAPTVTVRVTNTTGREAMLSGWIDINRNGVFENATERTQLKVSANSRNSLVTLKFPVLPLGSGGATYLRLRLSTDSAAKEPIGSANDGEVEDHRFFIRNQIRVPYKVNKSVNIGDRINGGPDIGNADLFGWSSASVGDLNRDGIQDIVVTAPLDGGSSDGRGAVYVLFMNSDGRAKSSVKIAHRLNGGPTLADEDYFGTSVTSLGDIDGDGCTDIAVGAVGTGYGLGFDYDQGAVYIIRLNRNGTAKSVTRLFSGVNGTPLISQDSGFGIVEAIGDLNGDGVIDLAVGAPKETAYQKGEGILHILMMNANGTVAKSTFIANDRSWNRTAGSEDGFAQELAFLGDIDGDGTPELAALSGALINGNSQSRNIDLLSLASDGTLKKSVRINDSRIGLGSFPIEAEISGLSAVGDLDGNGVTDLAFSTYYVNDTPSDGAIYFLLLNADGTTKEIHTVGSSPQAPDLGKSFWLGGSITAMGDMNGDGSAEFIAGFPGFRLDTGRKTLTGGLTVLSMRSDILNTRAPTVPVVTKSVSPINAQPVFSWTEIESARNYEVWIQNTTTKVLLADGRTVSGMSFSPDALLPIGKYSLKVRSRNEAGVSAWSAVKSWTVSSPVQVPAIPDFHTRQPTLKWTALPGAVKYEVRIADSRTGRIIHSAMLKSDTTTWTTPKELTVAAYKFDVRGLAADGTAGAWSVPDEFRVGSLMTLQNLDSRISPRPEIRWQPLGDAHQYEFVITQSLNPETEVVRMTTAETSFQPAMPLPAGSYVVRVRATTHAGMVTGWSGSQKFSVEVPILSELAPEVGPDIASVFRWTGIQDALHYEVRILYPASVSGERKEKILKAVSSGRFELPVFSDQGKYQISVRAVDRDGTAGLWGTATQTVLATTQSVSAGTTAGQTKWSAVPSATSYRIQYVEVLKSGNRILLDVETEKTDFTPSNPLPLGTFLVYVRPISADGTQGRWSAPFTHTSRPAPGIPKQDQYLIPESVTLKWEPVAGAVSYNVMIRKSNDASVSGEIVVNQRSLKGLSLTIPNLKEGGYSWWVQANTAEGFSGQWSPRSSLVTGYVPVITNTDASWLLHSPVLTWPTVSTLMTYNVVVRDSATGRPVFERSGLVANQVQIPELAAGNYAWSVQAVDAEGNTSRWSLPGIVRTGAAPLFIKPSFVESRMTFQWVPLPDAVRYEFRLGYDYGDLVVERNLKTNSFKPSFALFKWNHFTAVVHAFAADGTTYSNDVWTFMLTD